MSTSFDDQMRPHIRWLSRLDMEEVLSIERQSFAGEHAWTEKDFVRALKRRNVIGVVAEQDDRVAGMMIYELRKCSFDIWNLAVAADARRRGVGRALIGKLQEKLSLQRRAGVTAVVRETNLAAQLFFRSVGFTAERILRDYFEDADEDAYLFAYRKPDPRRPFSPENRIGRYAGDWAEPI